MLIAIFLGGLYSLISHLFIIDGTIVATIFGESLVCLEELLVHTL